MFLVSALVVDTSSWISYFAGRGSALIDDALEEARLYLPPIVAAELLSGRLSRHQRRGLEDLLSELPLCLSDLAHWFRVGRMRAALGRRGIAVSTPDAHIAQCVLDLDGELLTEDGVFRDIARHQPLRLAAPLSR